MNQYFTNALVESGVDMDGLYYQLGLHCWCGHYEQDFSKYNLYDVLMGH